MRYLTVRISPSEGGSFHPLGERLAADPAVGREAIHHVELMPDDTVLLFGEGSGDRERYEQIMRDSPAVVDFHVSGSERWMAVSRFEPSEAVRRALELQRESDVVVETPIRFDADGSFRVTHLGSDASFRRLFDEVGDDDSLAFDVVETGEYRPDEAAFARLLTARQREVLEAAVEAGYYEAPRRATLNDVAEAVGIASTTAGEHLRKVEARVLGALVR